MPIHKSSRPLLGAHFSIAGGLHQALYRAHEYECTALQIFSKNARTWKERSLTTEEVAAFDAARNETGIRHIASHAIYLINIATPDPEKFDRSYEALKAEMIRAAALDLTCVVLHPGSHKGTERADGMARVAGAIRRLFSEIPSSRTRLLLETTAGHGAGIGHTFEQLADLLSAIDRPDRIGVCLDTSHIFAAGYDLRTPAAYARTMADFNAAVGMDRLFLLHLNDSKSGFNSRVDRHHHIGRGGIGLGGFACIMTDPRLARIPKIIETPKPNGKDDWDRINLQTLFSLTSRAKCLKERS